MCENALIEQLNVDNFHELIVLADLYEAGKARQNALDHLSENIISNKQQPKPSVKLLPSSLWEEIIDILMSKISLTGETLVENAVHSLEGSELLEEIKITNPRVLQDKFFQLHRVQWTKMPPILENRRKMENGH